MPQVDFAKHQMVCKIVYYGPGLSGKTTNLKYLHENLPTDVRGKMMSLQTEKERTLFFDFFPASLGKVAGFDVRLHVFTVPGQSFYNETRRSLLTNVDGLVFVADSDEARFDANLDSFENLNENLSYFSRAVKDVPMVVQYNKRDLQRAIPVEELRPHVNPYGAPEFEAVAIRGTGVFETQRQIVKDVLIRVQKLMST